MHRAARPGNTEVGKKELFLYERVAENRLDMDLKIKLFRSEHQIEIVFHIKERAERTTLEMLRKFKIFSLKFNKSFRQLLKSQH